MNKEEIKDLSKAVATLDIECGELLLAPEGAEEHAITAMIGAMSTPVDANPLSAEEFLELVRAGRVTTASPYDGDHVSVMIDLKWADKTEIQWVYEIPAAVDGQQEPEDIIPDTAYGLLVIKEDELILRATRNTVIVGGRIFTVTQP
jgi:hypothetical protein